MASVKSFVALLRPRLLLHAQPRGGTCRCTVALQIHPIQARSIRTRGRSVAMRREIVGLQSTPFERPSLDDDQPKRKRLSARQLFGAGGQEEESESDGFEQDEDDRIHKEQQQIVADQRSRKQRGAAVEDAQSMSRRSSKAERSTRALDNSDSTKTSSSKQSDLKEQSLASKNGKSTRTMGVSSPTTTQQKCDKKTARRDSEPRMERVAKTLEAFPFVPGATTQELTFAHKFFFQPATFVKSASTLEMLPQDTLIPEVAFIGRSNIGKSSLINGLVNRNGLVKTSSKPGHTRLMNFFKIGGRLSLVDMPGYGFKSRDEWGDMILKYFQNRSNLKRIYILVDPSHGIKESDKQIMTMLDNFGLSYQVILTKADKLSKTKLKDAKAEIEAELARDAICCFPQLLAVSSKHKQGLDELRAAIIKAGLIS